MPCVALSQLGHEVTIEHRLPHLHLLILLLQFVRSTIVTAGAKASNSRLVEDLIVLAALSAVDIGKHVVNP